MPLNRLRIAIGFAFLITISSASGQLGGFPSPARPRSAPPAQRVAKGPPPPMKKANELIRRQEPIRINPALINTVVPADLRIVISLTKQRAYLLAGNELVVDSPISSGKRGHSSPTGSFNIREKDPDHRSNIYGDFVDSSGRIVRAGVSSRIDSAPSGTRFIGSPMKWFMRLTDEGVGMHVGFLPGYPASHGCIRMPEEGAKLFYDRVKIGTPVQVTAES